MPDLIACRLEFRGEIFRRPVRFEPAIRAELLKLVPSAPMHIPLLLAILDLCENAYQGVPVVLVFETAFFVDLPLREQLYALEYNIAEEGRLRRFGFHGIYHEAAALLAEQKLDEPAARFVAAHDIAD